MGPDLDVKGRIDNMVGLDSKENAGAFVEPVVRNMTCASNYQDNIFDLEASMHEQAEQVNQVEKSGVKILECTHQSDSPQNEDASQDTTENSSSYSNTASGDENDDSFSDSEVMSKLHDNGFGEDCQLRKKRLTSHWKAFMQPYMWRCRWAELRIRSLLYRASKYDLQAEAVSRRKQSTSKDLTADDSGAKSSLVSSGMQREKIMKRRKRKRVEDSTDKAVYMAQHKLFSCFGRAFCVIKVSLSYLRQPIFRREKSGIGSKRTSVDVVSVNDWANLGIPMDKKINVGSMFVPSDELVSLEFRNEDNSLEQILWNIGVSQSHLSGIKARLKKEGDKYLTYNNTAKELNNIVKVEIHPMEKLETSKEDHANIVPSLPAPAEDQPTPKIRYVSELTSPHTKRKRARRKVGW